jgi:membrane-associated protease RseP (regulator of RpoE activity)
MPPEPAAMRLNEAFPVFVAAMLWAAPLSAQSAFEQLEQQVQRDNARSAAGLPAATPPAQEPGYLGVIAEDRQGGGKGLNVIEVIAGSPAENAGLKAGDFITAIDGHAVHSMQDFERILSVAPAGKKLPFQITRSDKAQNVEVMLGQRPPPGQRRFGQFGQIPATAAPAAPAESRGATLGVRIASVTPELQRSLALPNAGGALVVAVVAGSPASQAGIAAGNVIQSVNGQRVDTPSDLSRLIGQNAPGREVTIGYYNGTATVERKTVLAAGTAPGPQPGEANIGSGLGGQPFLPGEGAGGLIPGQPPGGQFGGAPMPGQFGPLPGQAGGPGQLGAPGQYGGPGQFGTQAPTAADVIRMLEQRVQDLERRVQQLEQSKTQPPPASGPKATPSSDQQT